MKTSHHQTYTKKVDIASTQTDRQTDRQTDIQRERERERAQHTLGYVILPKATKVTISTTSIQSSEVDKTSLTSSQLQQLPKTSDEPLVS